MKLWVEFAPPRARSAVFVNLNAAAMFTGAGAIYLALIPLLGSVPWKEQPEQASSKTESTDLLGSRVALGSFLLARTPGLQERLGNLAIYDANALILGWVALTMTPSVPAALGFLLTLAASETLFSVYLANTWSATAAWSS